MKPLRLRSPTRDDSLAGYLFIAPNLILFAAFTLLPFVFTVAVSFTDWDYTQGFAAMRWNGGKNYLDIWGDRWFLDSLWNTIFYVAGTVPLTIGLAVVLATVIERVVAGKAFVKLLLFIPYISNIVAVSIVWTILLAPSGPLAKGALALGFKLPVWLADPDWVMTAIVAMSVWLGIGYAIMIYSAALGGIPDELYESAEIDGANPVQKFFRITLPMLSHTTFFLTVTLIVAGFKVFGQIFTMTQGGPGSSSHVLVYYIYTAAFRFFRMGYASTVSLVLFLFLLGVTILQWSARRRKENQL
jgi:multiple sugar transport system permease protein